MTVEYPRGNRSPGVFFYSDTIKDSAIPKVSGIGIDQGWRQCKGSERVRTREIEKGLSRSSKVEPESRKGNDGSQRKREQGKAILFSWVVESYK